MAAVDYSIFLGFAVSMFMLSAAMAIAFLVVAVTGLAGHFKGSDSLVVAGVWAAIFWVLSLWVAGGVIIWGLGFIPNGWAATALNCVSVAAGLVIAGELTALAYFQDRWRDLIRRRKGAIGERQVARAIRQAGFSALHDIYVMHDGEVAQIDHLVQVGSRLLVIETKNFAGDVFGKQDEPTWTRKFDDNENITVRNPLLQNKRQVRIVRGAFRVEVQGLVAFARLTDFPMGFPNGTVSLEQLPKLLAYLASRDSTSGKNAVALQDVFRLVGESNQAALKARHEAQLDDFLPQRPVVEGEAPIHVNVPSRQASEKQMKYGRDIATRLGIPAPDSTEMAVWGDFIERNKGRTVRPA